MNWDDLIGHAEPRQWFRAALTQNRLASTFLFVGPAGIGKRTFALLLAKTLLCERVPPRQMQPCGACEGCIQVEAGTHPDLLQLAKPPDRAAIPVELLIGDRESRMQVGFCHDIHLRPSRGRRRVAILDDADHLNQEGANCLLKTLEEPPPHAIIILIGTSPQRQLPTIRSRSQVIRFRGLTPEEATELMTRHGAAADPEQVREALELAGGDLHQAQRLLDEAAHAFREQLTRLLTPRLPEAVPLARMVSEYVDQAGTEAPRRRERLREVLLTAAEHYRQQIRRLVAAGDASVETAIGQLERSLDALGQVDRNANQATLIEAWAVDLQRIGTA